MLDDKIVEALKLKYSHIHPLILHRSIERARSNGDLFDILYGIPSFPIVWSDSENGWVHTNDFYLTDDFIESNDENF